jgi:hypothetical protein
MRNRAGFLLAILAALLGTPKILGAVPIRELSTHKNHLV